MKNVTVIDHPVLQHKLGYLRDKRTNSYEFRNIMKEVSRYLAYLATSDLEMKESEIETPLVTTKVQRRSKPPVVVSIMRAGNGMLDGVLMTLPFASAGHIGIYRDKFINTTVEYYFKLPENSKGRMILLADPMVATADTAIAAITRLKQYGVGPIRMLCILASETGLTQLLEAHPDVEIFTLSVEKEMNEKGYLLPGLGDAGDRLYQTK